MPEIQKLLLSALGHYRAGELDEAEARCREALAVAPTSFDAFNLLGLVHLQANRPGRAAESFAEAIGLDPQNPGGHNNLGMALRALLRPEDAVDAYGEAIRIQPDYAAAHANLGNALTDLGRFPEAIASYDRALELRPDHADTLVLRGIALQNLNRHNDAISTFDQAIAIHPRNLRAHERKGVSLSNLKRNGEAIDSFEAALRIDPDHEFLAGTILRERTKLCAWQDFQARRRALEELILSGARASRAFATLPITADPTVQKMAAETQLAASVRSRPTVKFHRRSRSEPIRLGVFSADFHNHPMMHLMAEVFSRIDRRRFRLAAFSFSTRRDEYTEAAEELFDDFVPITTISDRHAATLSRDMGIDIAIDRKGHTRGARHGIFLNRAAPIQVNYIAYPGTSGSPEIDYIIADDIVIPAKDTVYYSERVAYLPHCYLPRDTTIAINSDAGNRASHGLPAERFVFCCFNAPTKVMPEVFDLWMSILRRVPGSVLWLLDRGNEVTANLCREAAARSVEPARLIFAGRQPLAAHLARHRLADLFLDTLPYNAHTTASDALWAGLPVVTRIGSTFAGRVAASLLNAIGLPELITKSADEYEHLVVHLALNPDRLAALRGRLQRNAVTHPLFDMKRYTHDLERLFEAMHQRHLAGLPPEHIHLA